MAHLWVAVDDVDVRVELDVLADEVQERVENAEELRVPTCSSHFAELQLQAPE